MALKFLPYEIEAVSPSFLIFKEAAGPHQYENEASWQFLEVNGAEPPVFNILASTPLTCLTHFSWSAREKWNENQYLLPKALMRFYSLSHHRGMSDHFTARLPLTNCRLSPYKTTLYEIKSWNGCHLIIFPPFLQHIFHVCISAFRCQEDKYFSNPDRSLWRPLLIASRRSLVLWIPAFRSFQEVPLSTLVVNELTRSLAPSPQPWLWPSFTETQAAPYLQAWSVSFAQSCPEGHVAKLCCRNAMASP